MSTNVLTCGDRPALRETDLRPLLEDHADEPVWLVDPGYQDGNTLAALLQEFPNLHVDADQEFVDRGEISRRRRDVALLDSGIDLVLAYGDGPRARHIIRHASARGIEVRRYPAATRRPRHLVPRPRLHQPQLDGRWRYRELHAA